jgi:hypothetical protein
VDAPPEEPPLECELPDPDEEGEDCAVGATCCGAGAAAAPPEEPDEEGWEPDAGATVDVDLWCDGALWWWTALVTAVVCFGVDAAGLGSLATVLALVDVCEALAPPHPATAAAATPITSARLIPTPVPLSFDAVRHSGYKTVGASPSQPTLT